jgi:hypothetical protein
MELVVDDKNIRQRSFTAREEGMSRDSWVKDEVELLWRFWGSSARCAEWS